jgi:hypothetical protein
MHPDLRTFSVNIPVDDTDAMKDFQAAMDEVADAWNREVEKFAAENNVTWKCASDVMYLRTRSRWTQELEDRLMQLYKDGKEVNIFEWPEEE